MLSSYVAQALLRAWDVYLPYDLVVLGTRVEEEDRPVAKWNTDGILIRQELYRKDSSGTRNVELVFHCLAVVDAKELHVLLVKDDFVYLLEVEDALDIVIMGRNILNVTLVVVHLQVTRSLEGVDLMLYQEAR